MKLRTFTFAMLASAMLVGCSTEDPIQPPISEQTQLLLKGKIDAINNVDATRLNDAGFENNDKIGVYVSTTNGLNAKDNYVHNAQYAYDSSTKAITSDNAVYWSSAFGAFSIYAYYPYNAVIDDLEAHTFAVNADQSTAEKYYGSDFVWASKVGVEAQKEAVELTFTHALSKINVYLRAGEGITDEELKSATVSIEDVAISGNINLDSGVATANQSLTEVTPYKISDEGFTAVIYPQTAKICIKAVFNGKEYRYEAETKEFESATQYSYTLMLNRQGDAISLVSNGVTDWTNGSSTQGILVGSIEDMVNAIAVRKAMPYTAFGPSKNQAFDFGLPGIMCATDAATGDVVGAAGDDTSGYNWFWFWEVGTSLNSNQSRSQFVWNNYYDLIKLCNDIIAVIQNPQTDNMKAYLAYAKANRASFYLDMARAYDPLENNYTDVSSVEGLTVPKITETTTDDEARNNPRLSREDMFTFIFNDLTDAETLLTGNTFTGGKTIPSLGVVYGLMARAYLWLGGFDSSNYAQAATYAAKALEASSATIMSEAQWLDPKTGFNTPNNSWMWYVPQSPEGVTNLVNFVAWRSGEATWGYGQLVQQGTHVNFYNRIPDTDWRKRAFIGPDPDAWYEANAAISNYSADAHGDKLSDYFAPYTNVKFRPMNGETMDWMVGNPTSICLMRAEEMILTEIEALAYTDPTTAAAKLKAFMLTRDSNYSFTGSSTEDVVAEAIWQKRVELWGEGVVFYDLKRLNYGIETGYLGTNVATDSRMVTEGRAPWWNFAIPEQATQQNPILQTTNNPDPCDLVPRWTVK